MPRVSSVAVVVVVVVAVARSQLQLPFHPWPGNIHMLQGLPVKREREKKKKKVRECLIMNINNSIINSFLKNECIISNHENN